MTAEPTPRDGTIGGIPGGTPEMPDPRSSRATQAGVALQIQTGTALALAGYCVEWQPATRQSDGIAADAKPDMRLGGNIADVTAPPSSNPDQIRKRLSGKVADRQAYRLVLNLARTSATRQEIEAVLSRRPITGLKELFIVEQDGSIHRIFPKPERIALGTLVPTSAPLGQTDVG
jgi:filamentous hemagglutinin